MATTISTASQKLVVTEISSVEITERTTDQSGNHVREFRIFGSDGVSAGAVHTVRLEAATAEAIAIAVADGTSF